jgi:fermentation-respiration switch protein FrsA (DUF1100 family)
MRVAARVLLAAIGVLGLFYAFACAYLWVEQRSLIFLPDAVVRRTPADLGLAFREVSIPMQGGNAVSAWWLPAEPESAPTTAVLLYLHGNDGNLGREADRLRSLHEYGFPVLAIDYRGYGRSGGPKPSESQVYEDATAAWDYLVGTRGVDPRRIVIYGHSLGGAVAVELALRRGPACGVVLEATFTSMSDMGRLAYPWLPVDRLLRERFDTLRKVSRLALPLLFVHGTADAEIPSAMSEKLYGAARGDKWLVLVPGAGHEEALPAGGVPLLEAVTRLGRMCGAR